MANKYVYQFNLNQSLIRMRKMLSLAIFHQMYFVTLNDAKNGFYCEIVSFI